MFELNMLFSQFLVLHRNSPIAVSQSLVLLSEFMLW